MNESDLLGEMLDAISHVTSTGYELVLSRPSNGADSYIAEARKPGEKPVVRYGVTITESIRLLRSSMERYGRIVKAR